MDRYIYVAIFTKENDAYNITFPDLPGCYTYGATIEEAYNMAKEALELHLYGMEEDGDEIPVPIAAESIKINDKNSFTTLIEAYMPLVRSQMLNKAVKKTLTIPKWLNDLAEEHNINFSQLLQDSLKNYLGVYDYKK
ncbi:type II toxin-antitoxin system HicB family antitoxin [Clostridium botulinum]|uniref:Pilus assembly protein HicB n=1 Tax=Clostridium botulinum C/D str. DC5 TaxID=1443128 RepID=A0A0A0IL29_CLOBO|nr:type II toxin-antitoxin system HicB family antitoxin [Clostridium botulinum]KGN00952.1 pilus assembly protein HicB [Clostridium botulinum C/D str. DC5]KOC52430.1 pilus assembly protein HicB [Clostridium botulinum]KOC55934.1 pilus assembly protein HicB [Clostridium botulinum]MCD3233286.1 type II toxin-antitoxin system HicB family antitoxin [Clostridium botulinum D/C]MCD3239035.1 type II toxin-antitoxin system HicB family antitoxin [Clostridium botulinum D/C]